MLDSSQLESILENPKNFSYSLLNDKHDHDHHAYHIENNMELFNLCFKFLSKNYLINQEILVSLSGGVDSMVLLAILNKINPGKITALHLNYKNRDETDLEEEFLRTICKMSNIDLKVKRFEDVKRGEINRNEYEQHTKYERFKFYSQYISEKNTSGIFLAHHRNDEQENIFSNLLKGKSLIDLSALKSNSIVHNVNILRPMVSITKDKIYEFAHKFNIPYFKDTTPDWSNRGKLRRKVFPVLKEIYNLEANLDKIGMESLELNNLIISKIIEKFLKNSVTIDSNRIIISNLQEYYDMPITFWSYILTKVLHGLNKNMISNKSLSVFTNKINSKFIGKINLRKNMNCSINNDFLIITLE
jgi:tRNA(Ile)-lysidine synthetase-like protein